MPEQVIAHIGVKGMKWGVRKRRETSSEAAPDHETVTVKRSASGKVETSGGRGHGMSEDAMRAVANRQKARASGRDSLSNKEMQDIITRMELEGKYNRVMAANVAPKSRGRQLVENLLAQEGKAMMKGKPGPIGSMVKMGMGKYKAQQAAGVKAAEAAAAARAAARAAKAARAGSSAVNAANVVVGTVVSRR